MKRLRKSGWKMILDLIMAVVLVLLYNKRALGLAFHEIAGLAICGLFIIHKLLNWKWIQSVTGRLFSRSTPIRQKLLWVLDLLLLICFGYILVSGILISKIVFPSIGGYSSFKMGHYAVSALALALTGIHVGMHMGWIGQRMSFLKRLPQLLRRGLAIGLSVVVLAFGTVQFTSTEMLRWLGSLGDVFTQSTGVFAVEGSGSPQSEETVTESQAGTDSDQDSETTETSESTDTVVQSDSGQGNGRGQGQRPADGSGPHGSGNESDAGNEVGSVLLSFMSILLAFAVLTAWLDFGMGELRRKKRLKRGNLLTPEVCDSLAEKQ